MLFLNGVSNRTPVLIDTKYLILSLSELDGHMSWALFYTLYTRLFAPIALSTKLSLKLLIVMGSKKDEATDVAWPAFYILVVQSSYLWPRGER